MASRAHLSVLLLLFGTARVSCELNGNQRNLLHINQPVHPGNNQLERATGTSFLWWPLSLAAAALSHVP